MVGDQVGQTDVHSHTHNRPKYKRNVKNKHHPYTQAKKINHARTKVPVCWTQPASRQTETGQYHVGDT